MYRPKWKKCKMLKVHLRQNIIYFLLKICLIWWNKFMCNFKYIFINEIGFIKKNVIIVGKSTRSRVLQDRLRLHGAPRGPMEQKKNSPSCEVEQRWNKIKLCGAKIKTPPALLPSLKFSIARHKIHRVMNHKKTDGNILELRALDGMQFYFYLIENNHNFE